jgi:hypothetical protein
MSGLNLTSSLLIEIDDNHGAIWILIDVSPMGVQLMASMIWKYL